MELFLYIFFSVYGVEVREDTKILKQDIRLLRISVLEVREEVRRNRVMLKGILKLLEGGSANMEEANGLPEEFPLMPIDTEEQFIKLEELLNDVDLKTKLVSVH